jgi:GNAT superfamily N-acetyltransferase
VQSIYPLEDFSKGTTMSSVIIRLAKRNDGKQLLALINALADFEKLKRPTPAARKRLLRDAFGKRKRFDAFLAFVDTAAVGYAIVFETYSSFLAKPTLYLEDIFVLPAYRGKKIGLKLFRHCLAEAKRRKCGRMEWMVLDWNVNAIRFYENLGAKQMKEWLLFRMTL